MSEDSTTNGSQQFRNFVDDFLSVAGPALENVVNSKAYGEMLGQTVGNLVALNRMGNDAMDLAVRNARLAGRSDVVSLHRQLARNEDKLEMVLETVERLEDELAAERRRNAAPADAEEGSSAKPATRPANRSSARRTASQDD
jgi:alkylhydroperoxidase family enzyme